jgi:hypothetical protein
MEAQISLAEKAILRSYCHAAAEQLKEMGYLLSKAEINGEPASKMSHQR